MNNEKLNINLAQGCNEIIIREGKAPDQLPIKAPVRTEIHGTIETVYEYLSKRIDKEQFLQEDCYIIVNREKVQIYLVTNEHDAYNYGFIEGTLAMHPAFISFGINNFSKVWTPTDLGMFIKMHRAYFPDKAVNMELVSTLMHFTADINSKVDRQFQENGSRTDNFSQIVNSNLPRAFTIHIPIFKGKPAEDIIVETLAQIDGKEVKFMLLSPGANEALESIRDKVIDEQLKKIRDIAPDIVIVEE